MLSFQSALQNLTRIRYDLLYRLLLPLILISSILIESRPLEPFSRQVVINFGIKIVFVR